MQPPAIVLAAEEPAWLYANGGVSVSDGMHNYFSAWFDVPSLDGGVERYPLARIAFQLDVAKSLTAQAERLWAQKAWIKGSH